MIELTTSDIKIVPESNIILDSVGDIGIKGISKEIEIAFDSNEFSIVGDDMVVVTKYEDAPQWLKDTIDNIVNVKTAVAVGDLNLVKTALDAMLVQLDVAKNTYQLSIVSSENIDQRITTAITSLNSSLREADATILDIAQTAVTPNEASAIALNALTASLSTNGAIGSALYDLQTAMTTLDSTTANDISYLNSVMQGEIEGNATAMGILRTYVGLNENGGLTGTGLLTDVEVLQKQNDGVIETRSGTYDVMLNPQNPNLAELIVTAEPYATWKTADATGMSTRLAHIGDVYIKYSDTLNGAKQYVASYKFIRSVKDIDDAHSSTDADGFTWALIVDQAAQDAYEQALNAFDLADNKRRVFTITPSGPYDEGDLWVKVVSGSNQIWKCQITREQLGYYNAADWSIASTDDTATVALQTGLANGTATIKLTNAFVGDVALTDYIVNEMDGLVVVYSGTDHTTQTGMEVNDIYIEKTVATSSSGVVVDVINTWRYSGTVWVQIGNNNNITALADLADGKRTVFSGSSVPAGAVSRDIWIPSADNGLYLQGEIYQYNGTAWILATRYSSDIEAVRSNLQSQVDGKVETYYSSTVPVGMTAINNGDYWYCTSDVSTYKKGKVYKYVHSTTSWMETADVSRYAFDIADGKASIFSSTSVPATGYKINDMLIVVGSFSNGTTTFSDGVVLSSTATRASGFTASDWIKKINDTEKLDEFVDNIYTPAVLDLQSQVDGQIGYYFYDSSLGQTPTSISGSNGWNTEVLKKEHHGDIAYNKSTNTGYYYDRITSAWILINSATNSGVIEALKAANLAQATADGIVVGYYAIESTTTPGIPGSVIANTGGDLFPVYWLDTSGDKVLKKYVNSIWVSVAGLDEGDSVTAVKYSATLVGGVYPKDLKVYLYYGGTWITQTANGIMASSESVTKLKAYLGTDGGTSTLVNDITSKSTLLGKSVDSRFEYNSDIVLNGVTYSSGFGLATNVTQPEQGIPAGQSEFWVNSDVLKVYDPINGKSTLITAGKINTDLIELKTEESGYTFTIDKTGIKIVQDGVTRLLIGKIS